MPVPENDAPEETPDPESTKKVSGAELRRLKRMLLNEDENPPMEQRS